MGRLVKRVRGNGEVVELGNEAVILTPDAFRRIVEDRIRARFDLSLTEFAAAFKAGEFEEDPAAYDLAVVSGASTR